MVCFRQLSLKWFCIIILFAYIPMITLLVITTCASTGICVATQLKGIIKLYSITSDPVTTSETNRQPFDDKLEKSNSFRTMNRINFTSSNDSDIHVTKFLVITTQKSGSTWFVRRLATHPEITTLQHEPLHKYNRASLLDSGGALYDWSVAQNVMIESYQKLFNQSANEEARVASQSSQGKPPGLKKSHYILGFKVMYNQVRFSLPNCN